MTTSTHWPHRQNWRRESKIYALVELGQEEGADPQPRPKDYHHRRMTTTVRRLCRSKSQPRLQTGDGPVISTDRWVTGRVNQGKHSQGGRRLGSSWTLLLIPASPWHVLCELWTHARCSRYILCTKWARREQMLIAEENGWLGVSWWGRTAFRELEARGKMGRIPAGGKEAGKHPRW